MKRLGSLIIITIFISVLIGVFLQKTPDSFSQPLKKSEVPEEYIDLYREAGEEYDVQWELLAAVHRVETKFSTMSTLESPKGAIGHYQFMPLTWIGWSYGGSRLGELDKDDLVDITNLDLIQKYGGYGKDGNGDGKADPYNLTDAAYTAASYLSANGASEGRLKSALFAYNQSDEYVDEVLSFYKEYRENVSVVKLDP
ncbi:lytic transglycosylase domain-containing protein [Alkalihalobacillus hwajinpoensis]|uniref:lytic transglycosylase domain-containing protein n=1 Tax=Guptibacillus hwajinpoensis TaxID=208199 RepID=UPI0018838B56|nr:lytic transglycosylase domain-containing protein [Pseudalkalibacillus hwajinpoensis]MBF0708603.1 lytic transglycosylase domain-containing protein [Pseudalkalibacillus hwajinpoensis]